MEKTPYAKKFRKGYMPAEPLSRLSLTERGWESATAKTNGGGSYGGNAIMRHAPTRSRGHVSIQWPLQTENGRQTPSGG
jgi:hypothetical protein